MEVGFIEREVESSGIMPPPVHDKLVFQFPGC